MKPLRALLGFIFPLIVVTGAAEPQPPAEITLEVGEELRAFESLPPQEALDRYRKWIGYHRRFEDEAEARLARNPQLPAWLAEYFRETPVLFENYSERRSIVMTVSGLPAEWVVRFLLELSRDERPMRSTRYDYDDPEFQKRMKEEQEAIGNWDCTGDMIFQRYGYGLPGGDNRRLAGDAFRGMNSAARLAQERAGVKNPSTPGTAGLAPDSERVKEVAKGMWGDKAILNQELGLGLDNAPVRAGSATVPERGRRQSLPASDVVTMEDRASPGTVPAKSTKYALFLACGLLAAGLAAVGWRRITAK